MLNYLSTLPAARFAYAKLVSTNLEANDLLLLVGAAFHLTPEHVTKASLLKNLEAFFTTQVNAGRQVFLFIDEAHEFLPSDGKTPATDALIQLLREGRQPGISMVLATQQPGVIHRDVMTQSDIVLAHRLTNSNDINALNEIMQTYLLASIQKEMAKQNKKAIMWDVKNAYFTWPMISAGGAFAFEKTATGYDAKSTGVNNAAGVRGLQFLVDMVNQGVVDPNMDYSVSEAEFTKGEVAMTINGPWSWGNLDKLGVNYGVAELPTLNGGKGNPFVGILSAGINASSPNTDLAVEFLENYLFQDEALKIMNDDKPLGAVTLKSFQKILESDERIKSTMTNAENGEIMPNIPQMTAYWFAEGAAIDNAMQGKQTVREALDTAAKQITK